MTQRPRLFRLILLLPILATVSLAEPATGQIPETGPGSGWVLTPPFFPRGALITLIAGNPNAPGPLQVELIYPDGYRIGPHFHPAGLHLQVKAGTMQVGVGDRVKWNAVRNLAVGDTATVPAGTRYYYRTKGQTWIAVTTTGPFVLNYANSNDDPSRSTPFGY